MTKAVIPSRQARDRDRPDRGLLFPVPSSLFPLAPLTLPSPRTCPRHFGHSRQGCTSPPRAPADERTSPASSRAPRTSPYTSPATARSPVSYTHLTLPT